MTMKHDKFSNYPNHISMYACRDENEFQQVLPVSTVWLKLVKTVSGKKALKRKQSWFLCSCKTGERLVHTNRVE